MTCDSWTVSSADNLPDEPIDTAIVGSWTDRNEAVAACADYIVDRCALRTDIRYAILHDANHPLAADAVAAKAGWSKEKLLQAFRCRLQDDFEMPEDVGKALKDYLVEAIGPSSGYDIETDFESDVGTTQWLFEVVNNTLTLVSGLIVKSVSYA